MTAHAAYAAIKIDLVDGKIRNLLPSMRNLLDKRVLRSTWTVRPSDGEPAIPNALQANQLPQAAQVARAMSAMDHSGNRAAQPRLSPDAVKIG
jgi:hypothetical protein